MSAEQRIWIKSPLFVFAPDQSQPVTGLVINKGKIETLLFNHDAPESPCDEVFDFALIDYQTGDRLRLVGGKNK